MWEVNAGTVSYISTQWFFSTEKEAYEFAYNLKIECPINIVIGIDVFENAGIYRRI